MSFQRLKNNSYCVGGRHHSAISNIVGYKISNNRIILIVQCSNCNRKLSMTVSDKTTPAEGVGDFFKSFRGKTDKTD